MIAYMEEKEGEHEKNPFLTVANPAKDSLADEEIKAEETPVESVDKTQETDETEE